MAVIRFQVSLERDGAMPEDAVVNVWHFDSDQTAAQDADDIAGRLVTFYQDVDTLLSTYLSGNGTIKAYDLAELANDPPRYPVYEQDFTFGPASTASFPCEVAICCSFEGDKITGVPQARRRGRIFLGPTGGAAVGAQVGGDMTVLASARTTIVDALAALAHGPDSGDGRLCVFSPTIYAIAQDLDAATCDVTSGWVDDRFDIQRRRGSSPTSRTTWTPA